MNCITLSNDGESSVTRSHFKSHLEDKRLARTTMLIRLSVLKRMKMIRIRNTDRIAFPGTSGQPAVFPKRAVSCPQILRTKQAGYKESTGNIITSVES